jgi:ABC-type dipeptide/oligopeptide/nickel transport system ATPase subunit
MQAYQFAIVGSSGRGKTMSFRNMNPETCGFINMEGKPLPFINKFKHYAAPMIWQDAYNKLVEFAKIPEITEVVFDSFSGYIDSVLKTMKETKRGFDVWTDYNTEIGKFLFIVKRYPKDLFVTAHADMVNTDEGIAERRIAVKGNEWNKVGIEKDFTVVNYAGVKIVDGKKEYVLYLNSDGKDSSKTPPFIVEQLGNVEYIPNDANLLLSAVRQALNN